jgi:chorismate mutase
LTSNTDKNTALNVPCPPMSVIDFTAHKPFIIAGPCSAESETQVLEVATALRDMPVQMMRAGVWKPRTKPGSFEGMGEQALPWLQKAKTVLGKPICIEVASPQQIELTLKHDIDCLWIGARTTVSPFVIQQLADALKGVQVPVMIKNPINPDVDLWQGAIERIMNAGITNIATIHRGFSSYDKATKYRNKPNWSLPIELRRRMPNIPMICDPSHITGNRDLIEMVSQRALDLRFDGLMIETHPTPDTALSDAAQQITPATLKEILARLTISDTGIATQDVQLQLESLRQQIDSLDAEVVDLLARRMNIVEQIADVKKLNAISVYQPERWQHIIETRTKQGAPNQLDEQFILKLFEVIHDKSIKVQFTKMHVK